MQKYDIFSRLHNRRIGPRVALRLDTPSAVSVPYSTIPVGSPNLLKAVLGYKAPYYPDEFTPSGIFLEPAHLGHDDGSGSNPECNLTAFVQVMALRTHVTYSFSRSLWSYINSTCTRSWATNGKVASEYISSMKIKSLVLDQANQHFMRDGWSWSSQTQRDRCLEAFPD